MDTLRTCSECGSQLAEPEFYSVAKGARRDSKCKTCRKAKVLAYRRANRDEIEAKRRAKYAENPEPIKARARKWYWDNPELARELRHRYHNTHLDEHKAYMKEYAARPSSREWRKAWVKKQWEIRPDEMRRKWAESAALRRARLAEIPAESVSRTYIIERDKARCHFCGKKCKPNEIHLDHLIPVSWGEHSEHTRRNLAVACKECNQKNGAGRLPAQLRLLG